MLIDKDTHPFKRYTHTHTNPEREWERERGTAVVLALHLSVCRNMARTAEKHTARLKSIWQIHSSAARAAICCCRERERERESLCSLWLSRSALALSALRSKRQTALPFYNKIDANCKQTFSRQFNSLHATRKNKRRKRKDFKLTK